MTRVVHDILTTIIWPVMLILLILMCLGAIKVEAQAGSLRGDEVEALREIATQLGKKDWNFSINPCSNDSNWVTPKSNKRPLYNNTVKCNCSYPGGVCHVISIYLKGQDLAGMLPPFLVKLPYLKEIDLTRNYLSGTIPHEWASTKLEYLALTVNQLSGPIPSYLGNFTSLKYMNIENNLFSGTVPPELGNLNNLENLILSANNLTGGLPLALTNLTELTELRISSNNFMGRIPDFLGTWKQLQILEIQGSGLEGPIPDSISDLNNLNELRISDLDGEGSAFPYLRNMKGMKKLMLRNCNINGTIPVYISEMTQLKILDLSFNRLEGHVPDLEDPPSIEKMYLTSNLLTGLIPPWIQSLSVIDLSYNSFSENSMPPTCRETLNLFNSSSGGNNSKHEVCLENFPCSRDQYSLHINCGGGPITIGNINYAGDQDAGGAAKYVPVRESWEISSTGHFWDTKPTVNDYIAENVSILRMNNSGLYTRARLSPLSLTYHLRCLAEGNYTVKLHFAEIVIRGNRSFQSLGRRIFDVYIQGKLVLKDFDIENEAQGVDKIVIKEFETVAVRNRILEIRFHWAGKGTTAAPRRGIYGPLISAISVNYEVKRPSDGEIIIFIAAGTVVFLSFLILLFTCVLWCKGQSGLRASREQDLKGLDLQTGIFTFRQIKAATNNFNPTNKIGEGGFGSVYKGKLLDGTIIAVKQLSSKSRQGNREFVNEIGMISGLQHPNLVRLYGCCIEDDQLLLVYEYMENNSLARALFGPEQGRLNLDWPTRKRICIGIAKGLAFLHEESTIKIVHRDIKSTNVLLDKNLNSKISDFGLAKLDEDENTHITTRVAGTIGYIAPEYALWGYLTYKADVYSFGVVTLEIVAGRHNTSSRSNEDYVCLLDWALVLQQKANLIDLVDPKLRDNVNDEEVIRMMKIALLCTNTSPALRPTMSTVVSMLEGKTDVGELVSEPNLYGDELRIKSLRKKFDHIPLQCPSDIHSLIHSCPQWISSSSASSSDRHQIKFI